jgi:hypothetical protein
MNNIFNIKGFPSDDDDFSVGGVHPAQPTQSSVGRPQKSPSYEKPFEKYMEEPKEGKGKGENSKESAVMESPLLAKMGKVPAEMKFPGEIEDLGGKSAAPFPASFPTKEAKSSAVHSHAPLHEAKKSASSHKMAHEHNVDSSSKVPSSHSHVKKGSLGGEEAVGDEDIALINSKKKAPDEVVWGTSIASNKSTGDAMGGDVTQKPIVATEAVGSKPKLRPEVALKESTFEDKGGMVAESPKTSKKIEDNTIPVIGGEVKTPHIVVPHTPVNISVTGVAPVEAKAPTAPTSAVIKSLVEQIVGRVDTLTKGERMESVITLKPSPTLPPGFENATIRLTSVASARGEVNINFGGLTQSAAQLVQNNQADLLNALAARGVTVHIFSASTQQDPIAAQASSSGNQQQQQAWGQSSQQQRQQQDQEEGEYT